MISFTPVYILFLNLHGRVSFWQDEQRLQDALRFANACGAITVMERGAIPALPTKEAVQKMLSNATPV